MATVVLTDHAWPDVTIERDLVERGDPAQRRQCQGDGMVGHFFDAVVGHVRYPCASRGGLRDGDVVQADTHAGDDA